MSPAQRDILEALRQGFTLAQISKATGIEHTYKLVAPHGHLVDGRVVAPATVRALTTRQYIEPVPVETERFNPRYVSSFQLSEAGRTSIS